MKMEVRESGINKCRVCLDDNVAQDWNEIIYGLTDLTYRDCYYKYTQLEYLDEDNFYDMLCLNCSNSLEFIEAFTSKAIKTHIFLQEQFRINIKDDVENIKQEPTFETVLVDETEINNEISTYEDSNEEFITSAIERETCSREETCSTPLKKRKPKRSKVFQEQAGHIANEEEKNVNGESFINDKKNTKRISQSICCSICSKVLSSKYRAILHEQTHVKNRERNETCPECGLKFFSKGILRQHMLTHAEHREKPHKCEFCDKAFYYKGGLNIHRRIHLGQMISCSLCTKKYYREVDLEKHMASHSAAKISSDIKTTAKLFLKCKQCGKSIRTTSYRSHTAMHENEPLFRCSICDKEFFRKKSCFKHLKVNHKKTSKEFINFIIEYKNNRLSHLFLKQNTDLEVKYI